jgi:outer membrane lipoprotein-sorting protein
MNDLRHPCESWAEPISLAAAGCLSPDEQQAVRRHLETCSDCRERLEQLTRLCGVLAKAQLSTVGTEAAIVERVMSAVASEESRQPTVCTYAESIHPTPFARSLSNWRSIMRSPVSRVAAAAVLVLAIGGVALWFHAGSTTAAFADFVAPILEAKSAKFKMSVEYEMQPPLTFRAIFLAPNRMRQELPGGQVNIADFDKGKMVGLDPKSKRMTVFSLTNFPKDKLPKNYFAQLQSQLLDTQAKPNVKREPLGEKDIGGRRAIGYRISSAAQVLTLWGDPKTGLPVRIETTVDVLPKTKTTWTEFEFDVAVDESLLSLAPPTGYTVVDIPIDASPPTENDLTATLRQYSEMNGGTFPDAFDTSSTMRFVQKLAKRLGATQKQEPTPKQQRELMGAIFKLNRGFMFALQLPPAADAHYAGKGLKLGAADKPIFWYRPRDAKKYRVIYADLSVREADTPPKVPNSQPVPATAGPKK